MNAPASHVPPVPTLPTLPSLPPVPTLPSLGKVAGARARVEIVSFLRTKEATLFTLLFPVVLLLLFGSIFGNEEVGGVKYSQVMVAGILASGVASTSFMSVAIGVAIERDAGLLKRLAGTPMPYAAYFLGKVALVVVTSVMSMMLTLFVGALVFDVRLPGTVDRWVTFMWVSALGITACTLAGIAFSSIVKSARSAAAIVNFPFVILNFISGIYVSFWSLPSGLQVVASMFPLKWMAQGYRSVVLPDSFQPREVAGSWEHGRIALVLGAWCIIGLVLCIKTFRWLPRER
jgi:ABC-2 type transport system permease protein